MTATALAPIRAHIPAPVKNWSEKEMATIRRTLAVDATADEFDMFIGYCRVKGLDPIKGEAILVVYGKASKERRKATIITTQAGYRTMAERAGGYHPAKPGDTVWTYTPYHLKRQQFLDEAGSIFIIEERKARLIEIEANMPAHPDNPDGLLECRTVIYKHGQPVAGIARWKAYAPLTPADDCFEWVGTGEYWTDKQGNPTTREKQRRKVKQGVNLNNNMVLDASGRWVKDGPGMLEKCATVHALKAAFPDTFDDKFNTEDTIEHMRVADLTASELAEIGEQERRQHAVGQSKDEYVWNDGSESGDAIYPAGQFGDAVLKSVRACKYIEDYIALTERRINKEFFNRFWANHKNDALDVKEAMDEIKDRLPTKPKPVTIEHEPAESVPAHA